LTALIKNHIDDVPNDFQRNKNLKIFLSGHGFEAELTLRMSHGKAKAAA